MMAVTETLGTDHSTDDRMRILEAAWFDREKAHVN